MTVLPTRRTLRRAVLAAGDLLATRTPQARRLVLCYHSVHPTRRYPSSSPALFDDHMRWLASHCSVVPLAELFSSPPPAPGRPLVSVTFDDGHRDNCTQALPILQRHGLPATFFVTVGYVDRDPSVVRRLAGLLRCTEEDLDPLSWEEVAALRAAGMEVGSHTCTHPNLMRLSAAAVDYELKASRDRLGERLGGSIRLFAYPFGKPRVHFSSRIEDQVRAAGFQLAAAVNFRPVRPTDSSMRVPRYFADGDDLAKLQAKIRGAYDLLGLWQERAPRFALRIASPADFER